MSFIDTLKDLIAKEEESSVVGEGPQPEERESELTEQEKNLERLKELDKEYRDSRPRTEAPENESGVEESTPEEHEASEGGNRRDIDPNNLETPPAPLEVPINPDLADMILSNNLTPGAMKALTADKLAELKGKTQGDFFHAVKKLNEDYPAPSGRIEEAGAPEKASDESDWTLAFFE